MKLTGQIGFRWLINAHFWRVEQSGLALITGRVGVGTEINLTLASQQKKIIAKQYELGTAKTVYVK